ncbi:ATP-binding cassette domain-containing protein [Pusillibacter faecalis]|uniref:ATP-binding cassette domain-containing protein n=1 Tax=Pusillibacter faecalis TaxID=2714358 RepID=UPI0029437E1F|nr:ATP-binding cassette domain-containing protein [Pusillibacter faecalis]
MEDIVIRDLCKSFDGKPVLCDFSAVLPAGQVTGLMAPSGAGKTTLLRILMGLERPDSGAIDGLAGLRLSAVFQEDRLCDNLDPSANIRLSNPSLERREAEEALTAVGLAGCLQQPVRELSGGMCRRVAILRALLAEYDLLFLDEPFKGLDRKAKETVMADTRRRCAGRTVLLVTHDAAELDAMGAVVRLDLNT